VRERIGVGVQMAAISAGGHSAGMLQVQCKCASSLLDEQARNNFRSAPAIFVRKSFGQMAKGKTRRVSGCVWPLKAHFAENRSLIRLISSAGTGSISCRPYRTATMFPTQALLCDNQGKGSQCDQAQFEEV
jgi:hypothetical protein